MMQRTLAGTKTAAALLKIDSLNLLLPQSDIRSLESSRDVDTTGPALNSVGWIHYNHKRWPVYCFTGELALLQIAPPERRACALLVVGAGYLGILCDDMMVLKDFPAQRFELPLTMKFADTPIRYLAPYEQGIACISNANQLTAFIERMVATT